MWMILVIIRFPLFGLRIDLFDVPEQVGIEHILPIGTVEPFDIPVLARFSRLDVLDLDILDLTVVDKDPGKELRSVIDPYRQGFAIDLYGLPQVFHDAHPGHGEVPLHAQCLTVEVVH